MDQRLDTPHPDVSPPATEVAATAAEITGARKRLPTPRQLMILDWITDYNVAHGYPPTVREIGKAFSIRSTNGVHDHLAALERKGYLRRDAGLSRGIRVLDNVGRGHVDPAAVAIVAWKAEHEALRRLLGRIVDACGRAPSLTAELAIVLGDARAVLKAGTR